MDGSGSSISQSKSMTVSLQAHQLESLLVKAGFLSHVSTQGPLYKSSVAILSLVPPFNHVLSRAA